jgi:hypothetical protein
MDADRFVRIKIQFGCQIGTPRQHTAFTSLDIGRGADEVEGGKGRFGHFVTCLMFFIEYLNAKPG